MENELENSEQATRQIIVFKMGGEEYALDIQHIKEVVPTPPVSKVPLTPDYILGVANIRGNILAIVDLEIKFQLQKTHANPQESYALVVEMADINMAFLVNEIPNTFSVPIASIDQSPAILQEATGQKSYIDGIVKLEDRLIILIDIQSIVSKGDIQAVVPPT
ncbi:MAG: chemotaxis protein CheW [Flammeovirgaceae bacterium]